MVTALPDLRFAERGEWKTMGHVLGSAFENDPVSRWTLGGPMAVLATYTALSREVYLARGFGCFASDLGGAVWLGPGTSKLMPWSAQLRLAWQLIRLSGPDSVSRSLRVDEAMRSKRPADPHFYLFAVGVLPEGRGRGLARALIQRMTDQADALGLPCWLENTNPLNEPLYCGLGFEAVETFSPAPGCPPLTTMLRPPCEPGKPWCIFHASHPRL